MTAQELRKLALDHLDERDEVKLRSFTEAIAAQFAQLQVERDALKKKEQVFGAIVEYLTHYHTYLIGDIELPIEIIEKAFFFCNTSSKGVIATGLGLGYQTKFQELRKQLKEKDKGNTRLKQRIAELEGMAPKWGIEVIADDGSPFCNCKLPMMSFGGLECLRCRKKTKPQPTPNADHH